MGARLANLLGMERPHVIGISAHQIGIYRPMPAVCVTCDAPCVENGYDVRYRSALAGRAPTPFRTGSRLTGRRSLRLHKNLS